MSAFNIVLRPSHYAQVGLVLFALLLPLVMAVTALPLLWACLLTPLWFWFYWQWYATWQYLRQTSVLTLTDDGQLHGFANALASGQLCRGGLVSQHAVKLCWQPAGASRRCQRWIFSDQCSASEFRALARSVNQQNWLPASAAKG